MARKKDNTLPILTHILGLFTGFIGPLIILLASTDKKTRIHAKKVLNWQFSLLLYAIIAAILVFVLVGIAILPILGVLNTVFSIMGAVKASEGIAWRYPLSIKFFSV